MSFNERPKPVVQFRGLWSWAISFSFYVFLSLLIGGLLYPRVWTVEVTVSLARLLAAAKPACHAHAG